MGKINTITHPLVRCHLTTVRDRNTRPKEFRAAVRQLTFLAGIEATRDLHTRKFDIETPLTQCDGYQIQQRVGLVPILRAGVGMVEAMLELVPEAPVWHLGLFRDEESAMPVGYYNKLPEGRPVETAFILDPMLATGGSVCMACETLENWGVNQIKMIAIIAAPEGIAEVESRFAKVDVYTCAIDDHLNENKFIVPGLGDAGDRIFNTLG